MSTIRKCLSKKHLKKAGRLLAIMAAVAGVLSVAALGISFCMNEYSIELSIPESETIVLEYGETYDDSDVTARFYGTIWEKSGVDVEVERSGAPNVSVLGEYTVTYTASYKNQTVRAVRTIRVEDHEAPVISLTSDPDSFTNPNDTYQEEGYTARDNYDGDLTDMVAREEKDGVVTYTVEDSSHNVTTVTREIVYRDAVAPVLTLLGDEEMAVEAGEDYAEPGYTASDDCDGDITASVRVDGSVDTGIPGSYKIVYRVQDSSGNSAEVCRTVTVKDTKAPDITLKGDARIYVEKGTGFTDPGVTAKDSCDGDITDRVITDDPTDTEKAGIYTVRYTVSDSSGNQSSTERTVYVYERKEQETEQEAENTGEKSENSEKESSGSTNQTSQTSEDENKNSENNEGNSSDGKIIYLTFDDGPGRYTEKLLDILDKYDVKATFFVTNQYPKYQYLIAEEYKRGHTVAIHTYSHDYSTIYASESAFYEDINKMNDIIYEQTGTYATILRFPGGSSNTVSKKYCEGIMTALTESLEIMGFRYADWNVTSGDAGGTTSTSKVISNVISGVKKHTVSVVLQHDIHEFSVDAVEDIILWGLENGYTFRAMDETTQMVHHRWYTTA